MADKEARAHASDERESTLHQQADDVQSEAYELNEPMSESILQSAGSDADSQRTILSKVNGGTRAQLMTHLQQTVGNQQVQHLMNAAHSTSEVAPTTLSVQRQSEEEDLMGYMHAENLPSIDISGLTDPLRDAGLGRPLALPEGALGGLGQAWDTASGGVSGATSSWLGGVRGAVNSGIDAAAGAGQSLWGGASGAVGSLLGGAENAGSALWGGLGGAGSAISSGFDRAMSGDILGGLTSGVGGVAGSLWGGATGAVDAASGGIGGAVGSWLGGVHGAMDSGVQGAQNIGSSLWGGAQGAASSIGGAASSLWEQATGSSVPAINPEDLWM